MKLRLPSTTKRCQWCKAIMLWYVVPSIDRPGVESSIIEFCSFCDLINTGERGEHTQWLDGR